MPSAARATTVAAAASGTSGLQVSPDVIAPDPKKMKSLQNRVRIG